MVFLIHVLVTRGAMGVDRLAWFYPPLGSASVDIFFVISGFVIAPVGPRSAEQPNPARRHAIYLRCLRKLAHRAAPLTHGRGRSRSIPRFHASAIQLNKNPLMKGPTRFESSITE
jgi:hypothetical protein